MGKFPVKLAPSLNLTRRDEVVTKSEYQISALFINSQSKIIFELKLAPSLNKTRKDEVVTKSEHHTSAFLISQSEIIFRAG